MSEKTWLTRKQAADALGISIASIRRMEGKQLHPTIDEKTLARLFSAESIREVAKMRGVKKAAAATPRGAEPVVLIREKTLPRNSPQERSTRARLHRYAMLPEEYDRKVAEQDNRCAICTVIFTNVILPCIDHDHRTGYVRGLLCHNCNLMLGHSRDNAVYLRKAIEYLAKHKGLMPVEEEL